MHQVMSQAMKECIKACGTCHDLCLSMAMRHCLRRGGEHVAPEHFGLMRDCAEICQTAANFMLAGSHHHQRMCSVCAAICEACAKSCSALDDMQECVAACEHCAQTCRQMAAAA